jgi:hypothetical protein
MDSERASTLGFESSGTIVRLKPGIQQVNSRPRHGRVRLLGSEPLDPEEGPASGPCAIPLDAGPRRDTDRVSHAVVRFVTPTELKGAGQVADRPEFGILFRPPSRPQVAHCEPYMARGPGKSHFAKWVSAPRLFACGASKSNGRRWSADPGEPARLIRSAASPARRNRKAASGSFCRGCALAAGAAWGAKRFGARVTCGARVLSK